MPDRLDILRGLAKSPEQIKRDAVEKWRSIFFHRADTSLDGVPTDQITPELLAMANGVDRTLLHYVAEKGQLDRVPKELLTQEAMLKADKDGDTVLHWAARAGHLDQVPKELLTEETMATANQRGETVLFWAAQKDHIDQVPLETLDATIASAWAAGQWEDHPLNDLKPEAKAALERRFELHKEQLALGRDPVAPPEVAPSVPAARPDVSAPGE